MYFSPLPANRFSNATLHCTCFGLSVFTQALISLADENLPGLSSQQSYVGLNEPFYFPDYLSPLRANHSLQEPFKIFPGGKKIQVQTDGKHQF